MKLRNVTTRYMIKLSFAMGKFTLLAIYIHITRRWSSQSGTDMFKVCDHSVSKPDSRSQTLFLGEKIKGLLVCRHKKYQLGVYVRYECKSLTHVIPSITQTSYKISNSLSSSD